MEKQELHKCVTTFSKWDSKRGFDNSKGYPCLFISKKIILYLDVDDCLLWVQSYLDIDEVL